MPLQINKGINDFFVAINGKLYILYDEDAKVEE